MSTTARPAGAPSAPKGASLHSGISCESECEGSGNTSSSRDGNRSFDSQVTGLLAATSGSLVGWQHGERGHDTREVGSHAAAGEGDTIDKGRRSSTTWSASCSPSQRARVCSYSPRTTTDSPTQEPPACQQSFEFFDSHGLPPRAQPVEQRPSSSGRLREKVLSPSSQPVHATEAVPLTDSKMESEAVTTENAGIPSESAALKSSIPSVLITSPSLGRISVLCAPVASRAGQTAYLAENSSASIWTSQADSQEEARTPPTAAEIEGETPSTMQVSIIASPPGAPPPSSASMNGGGSRLCVGNTSLEREYQTGERAGWAEKAAARLGTRHFLEGARQIPASETAECVTSRVGSVQPFEAETTARRHSGRGVDQAATTTASDGQLELVTMANDRRLGSTAAFRCLRLTEHASATHTQISRSSSPMTAGRSGSNDERQRRVCAVGTQRDRLQFAVPPGAAPGGEDGKISQDGAGGPDTRRRFSLPAEGSLSNVIRRGGVAVAASSPVTQGLPGRRDAFPCYDRSVWRNHESIDKDGLGKKSRRQSVDFVRTHHEDPDFRFPPQSSASQCDEKEGRITVPVGVEGTAVAAAVAPRAGFPPGGTFRHSPGGTDDSLTLDRSAAFGERKNVSSWARALEEGSLGASSDERAAPAVPRSVSVREQGVMRLQQPLLSTAFRAAAHAAAAAARVRTSAATSGGKKTLAGGVGTTGGGRDVPKVGAESGSVAVASVGRAGFGDTSPSHHVKQMVQAVAELPATGTTAEGSTRDAIPERQLCRREADRGLRTTSGISVASSDQSSATRASAERQQRELLLLRAKEGRVVGEIAALAACVATACVKRAALHPIERLILNTLHHWQQKLEPVPAGHQRLDGVASQHTQELHRTLLGIRETDTAQHVSEDGTSSHAAFQEEISASVQGAETLSTVRAESSLTNTVHGTNGMSVPLSELLRGSLPPCTDAAALKGSEWEYPAKQGLARRSAAQPHGQEGSRASDLQCVRVTIFASKQVLRWRHLRQRVAVFTEKTSPYYFWPPWGGFRPLIEAGGSALSRKLLMSGELDGTDSDGGRFTSARHIDLEHSASEGECAEVSDGIRDGASSRQKEGTCAEFSFLESATPSSRGKTRVANEPQRVFEEDIIEDKQSTVNRPKLGMAAQSCIAEWGSTNVTPTKSKPDFVDTEIHRDTTATPSSPPTLGESGLGEGSECVSRVSAFVQQQGFQSLHSGSRQEGDGWQQNADASNSVSIATDVSCPSPRHAAASSTLPRESLSVPAGQDSCVDTADRPCSPGATATLGAGDKAVLNNEGIRVSKRERTLRQEDPDLGRVCVKDGSYNERSILLNYKDKHAVVPFMPNVLATTRATRGTTYRMTSPPAPLRLPFEEAGTVYVLRAESFNCGSSSIEEKSGVQASCRSCEHAANNSIPDSAEINCVSGLSDACSRERDRCDRPRNASGSPPQHINVSSGVAEEEGYENLKQSNREEVHTNVTQSAANIVAVWACAAAFGTASEKTEAPPAEKGSSSSSENASSGQAMQKQFWMCSDLLGRLRREGEANNYNTAGDSGAERSSMNQAGQQCGTDICAARPRPTSTPSESVSEPAVSTAASCHPPSPEDHATSYRTRHQRNAAEVLKAMHAWCQAASRSGVDRDAPQSDRPNDAAGSLKEISFESFASAYNDLAEKAVKQLLTHIRSRGEHALPPAACHFLEEKARIASRRRREEARCLQQQLRTKLQQLVQNYNRLVTAEHNLVDQNSSPDRGHIDPSQSSGHEHLEQQFQRRLRDLQQRVEYHLHQHRQLSALLGRHNSRQERRRRSSYPGTHQLSESRRAPRRRLQWYSVGIRWLRTRAALEYFVVRHRQQDVAQIQLPAVHCEFVGRQRRMQRLNPEHLNGQDGQPSRTGLSNGTGLSPPSNGTPTATCPSHTTEARPPAGLKRRPPGSQCRGSSSSGEDWKNTEQSTRPHSASGAACASGRSSVCGDDENKSAFYFPTVPPVGPVGMSPVTVSEASTPVTPDSPPLSSNEDGLSAVSSKGSLRQQSSGAYPGTHNHTSSVLLLHELLQPLRLDAGGIRAALVLVVLRLRRFIRVVRTKEQANNKERKDSTTCTRSIAHKQVTRSQRMHGQSDREIGNDVPSADGRKASQDYAARWAKVFTSGREGMNLRAQLSELTKLQSDCTELSTTSAKRSLQCRKSAEYSSAGDDTSGSRTSKRIADLRCTPDSKFVDATLTHPPWAGTASRVRCQGRTGREESTEVDERLRRETNNVSPTQRQFPWSSIRMALVLPNLGVQLQHILPSARVECGQHPAHSWMGTTKDVLVDRDAAGSVYPNTHSRHSVYERDALTRRGAETFAALSQTSQQLDSGSQSPAPRRLGVAGVVGTGDAAEARAARAAARAAAAETRIWRLREREEADARAGGLSDHAVYSGEGSVCPGKGERSRGRSSPERSIRKADGDGVNETVGDEEEDDTSGEPRSATTSGASLGKHGAMDIHSGQLGLTRTPSPQLPQRVRRSCGIPSASRSDCAVKRKQLWTGSDDEPYAVDTADSASRTRARSTVNENEDEEGNELTPVEGGALEPFWWRACCAKFQERVQPFNEEGSRRGESLKTACSNEVMADGSQPSLDAGNGGDAMRLWDVKDILVAEGKERNKVASGYTRHLYLVGTEAVGYSFRQESVKSTQRFRGDVSTRNSSCADKTTPEHMQHMVPLYPPLSPSSSSDITSSDEEAGSERGTSTTSESSGWSKSSSTGSDVSVEPSTVLQQLSARQVTAGTAVWSSTGDLLLAGQVTFEKCSNETRDVPQGSLMRKGEAEVCNGASTLMSEPAERSADMQSGWLTTPAAQEREHLVTQESGGARFPGFADISGGNGEAVARYSVECLPKSCLDQHEHSRTAGSESVGRCCSFVHGDKPKFQSVDAGDLREPAETDHVLSEQILSAAAPHLIVMPREESISADVRRMLPQLRVRFTTCALDLTSKKELEVLQRNVTHDCVTLRPRRAVRRLWNALHPILHTLQMFNRMEEGRGGWISGRPSPNLNSAGKVLIEAPAADGPQAPRSTETRADVICSAVLSAAVELSSDPSLPDSVGYAEFFKAQISEKDGEPVSKAANAVTVEHGGRSHVNTSFPRQVATLISQRIRRGEGLRRGTEDTKRIDKLKIIEDAILYLSGVLDVESAQVEAAKESAEDDALLSLLRFPGTQGDAGAVSQAPADLDVAAERDAWARFHVKPAYRGAVVSSFTDAVTGDDEKSRKKKKMKIEAITRSFSTDTPGGERRPVKKPTYSVGRQDRWDESQFSESLFDFGPKVTSAEEATSKIVVRCPRAFGRRTGGLRRPRLPGVRSGLLGDTSTFYAGAKDDHGGKTTWEDYPPKEVRLALRFPWSGDEGMTTTKWESRGRTPAFLRPDGWEALDDESASSSSAEKTSAYAPLSSGSESVYLSVPSSPRRRRQQRQLRWRSRHLAVGTSGAYHLTSAELGAGFTPEGLEKSFLESPKRAYGGRAPRRVGVGPVFRIFQSSASTTGGTTVLQESSSSQPLSPPLTRGAAASTPRGSQIYTRAEALSAGQGDTATQSECATRERRRTAQQDRLFSRYIPEKLSKRQFAASSSSQARRKSSVGRIPRSRAAPVIAAPSLEWSGPECSLATPTRKKMSAGSVGASQSTPKSHSAAGGMRHHLASSEGASPASPAGAFARSATSVAARGGSLDSPRETPRPGRRTPTAGSPVPTGVYFDASRKLWRCQWRENGRFKTKGFSLNTYGTLKDARKACIIYRCLMGGWEVDPRWLADNDSQDSGDNGLSEGHALEDEDNVSHNRAPVADGSQSEVEHSEVGDVAQRAGGASMPSDATDASEPARVDAVSCAGVDAERCEIPMAGHGEVGPGGHAKAADISCAPPADHMAHHDSPVKDV